MEQTNQNLNPNLIPRKVVSALEERLTSEGWEWKANELTMTNTLTMTTLYSPLPIPDEEIMGKYQGKFPNMDIRLEPAYDSRGKFLPWARAVYVMERSEK